MGWRWGSAIGAFIEFIGRQLCDCLPIINAMNFPTKILILILILIMFDTLNINFFYFNNLLAGIIISLYFSFYNFEFVWHFFVALRRPQLAGLERVNDTVIDGSRMRPTRCNRLNRADAINVVNWFHLGDDQWAAKAAGSRPLARRWPLPIGRCPSTALPRSLPINY